MSDHQGSVSKQTVPLISTQNSFQAQQHKKGKTKKEKKKSNENIKSWNNKQRLPSLAGCCSFERTE